MPNSTLAYVLADICALRLERIFSVRYFGSWFVIKSSVVVLAFLLVDRIKVGFAEVFKLAVQAKLAVYCNLEDASGHAKVSGVILSWPFDSREDLG